MSWDGIYDQNDFTAKIVIDDIVDPDRRIGLKAVVDPLLSIDRPLVLNSEWLYKSRYAFDFGEMQLIRLPVDTPRIPAVKDSNRIFLTC